MANRMVHMVHLLLVISRINCEYEQSMMIVKMNLRVRKKSLIQRVAKRNTKISISVITSMSLMMKYRIIN